MSRESMTAALEAPAPSRCFCQIAIDDLTGWARKRYLDHVPTIQLLTMARGPQEREAIGIIALLDVSDEEVVRMLTPLTPSGCDILACRDHVKRWLTAMLQMHPAAQGVTP